MKTSDVKKGRVKNFEQRVYEHLVADGFDVLRSGYPDFMVRRNGRYTGIAAIEVKQGSDKVRHNQKLMHDMFKEAGIPVYVIRPEDIYEKSKKGYTLKTPKLRFKKIIGATHYNNMVERINSVALMAKNKEDFLIKNIRNATVAMDKLRCEIDILINSIHVESVILKEPIDDSKTDVIVEAQDENK